MIFGDKGEGALFVEVPALGIKTVQTWTEFGLSLRESEPTKCSSLWGTQAMLLLKVKPIESQPVSEKRNR